MGALLRRLGSGLMAMAAPRRAGRDGDLKPVGLREPRPHLYWVAMPSFLPDEAQRAAYRGMNAELRAHHQRYQDADAVVIDLRGNQGGSSSWSLDFAKALWGDEAVLQRDAARLAQEEVWWRASPGNIAHMRWLAGQMAEQGQTVVAAEVKSTGIAMQAALERGDQFLKVKQDARAVAGQFYTPQIYAYDLAWSSANFLALIEDDLRH